MSALNTVDDPAFGSHSDADDDDAPGAEIDSPKEAKRWLGELQASAKWMERFHKDAATCEKKYMDDTSQGTTSRPVYSGKTNIFWSNVQVILSAIYGRLPKAEVKRKFDDYDDDVARVAGMMMERILNGDMEREWDDTNAAMRDAVQDRFIAGMGQVWCRYDADFDSEDVPAPPDPMTGQPPLDPATGQPQTVKQDKLVCEEAEVDYVYWADFRYSPCRRWRECRWVARRVYMTRARLVSRFHLDPDQAAQVPMLTRSPTTKSGEVYSDGADDPMKATPYRQAAIWEIWSRPDNRVYWVCEGLQYLLDTQPDPLELEDFFPCPQPVVATTLTKAFLPRPDYMMAQDLYVELDRVNARLARLTAAVKAVGVYDKSAGPAKDLLEVGVENQLIPVENWSAFTEKGGMKGVMDWLPIEAFVNAITQLNARKSQLQHDLYEVMGISDIMRGSSMASETATAQQLKVQYGGARLANLQNDVARFVSEVMRIRANIISNIFQPESIIKRSQIEHTPDAEVAQDAVAMIKDYGTSMYSITVTADSIAAPDWAAEKDARTEFLGAASNYIMAAGPVTQQSPMVGSFLIKLLQWAAAGFKGAQSIEGVLDQAAKQLEQQASAPPPPPPPPSPEDQKHLAQAEESKSKGKKADAEAERTTKEAALIPPISIGQPGPMGLPPGAPPGGMPPGGPQPAANGMGLPPMPMPGAPQ